MVLFYTGLLIKIFIKFFVAFWECKCDSIVVVLHMHSLSFVFLPRFFFIFLWHFFVTFFCTIPQKCIVHGVIKTVWCVWFGLHREKTFLVSLTQSFLVFFVSWDARTMMVVKPYTWQKTLFPFISSSFQHPHLLAKTNFNALYTAHGTILMHCTLFTIKIAMHCTLLYTSFIYLSSQFYFAYPIRLVWEV